MIYIIKNKIHSSCEIEYFVETHLCKLCVILRSRGVIYNLVSAPAKFRGGGGTGMMYI